VCPDILDMVPHATVYEDSVVSGGAVEAGLEARGMWRCVRDCRKYAVTHAAPHASGLQKISTQFTCVTSTKVQIPTPLKTQASTQ
jgi:hypothetical protein